MRGAISDVRFDGGRWKDEAFSEERPLNRFPLGIYEDPWQFLRLTPIRIFTTALGKEKKR